MYFLGTMVVCNRQEERKRGLVVQCLGGKKGRKKRAEQDISNWIWIYHLVTFQPVGVLACLLAPFLNRAFCHYSYSDFNGQLQQACQDKLCDQVASSQLAATAVEITRSDLIFKNSVKIKAVILPLKCH